MVGIWQEIVFPHFLIIMAFKMETTLNCGWNMVLLNTHFYNYLICHSGNVVCNLKNENKNFLEFFLTNLFV